MQILDLQQGSQEWLDMRKTHIGASEISCIAGTNQYRSAYDLWLEKTGKKEPVKANEAMQHGTKNEPLARKKLEEITEFDFSYTPVLTHDEHDFMLCSLDGYDKKKKVIAEIKSPFTRKLLNDTIDGNIPAMYIDQMQWQMMITEIDTCYFFVYINDDTYYLSIVKADKKRQKELFETALIFWNENVLKDIAPEKDISEYEYSYDEKLVEATNKLKEFRKEVKQLEEFIKNSTTTKTYLPLSGCKINIFDKKGLVNYKKLIKDKEISDFEIELYRGKSTQVKTIRFS